MTKVNKLAAEFEKLTGIKPASVVEWTSWADAAITINETYHIQVGRGYMLLCKSLYLNGELDGIEEIAVCKNIQQVVDAYLKVK